MSFDQELHSRIEQAKAGSAHKRAIAQVVFQRERGMWSFLTWSFFLSYLVGGGVSFAGAAQAADSLGLASEPDQGGAATNQASLLGAPSEDASIDDTASSEATPSTVVTGPNGQVANLQAQVAMGADPDGVPHKNPFEAVGAAAPADAGADNGEGAGCGCASGQHDDVNRNDDRHGTASVVAPIIDGNEVGESPGVVAENAPEIIDVLPDIVETAADHVVHPVIEMADDLLQTVNDGVLSPILDPVGDIVGNVSEDMLSPVTEMVGGLLETVSTDILTPLLDPLGNLVEGALPLVTNTAADLLATANGDILSPVLGPAGGILDIAADDLLSPVIAPASEFVADAVDIFSPVSEPAVDLVANTTNDILSPLAEPIFQSAGVIAAPVLEPAEAIVDTVLDPLGNVLSPAMESGAPILEPVSNIVVATPLGGLFSNLVMTPDQSDGAVSTDGALEFASTPPANGDAIFENGSYTSYGVTLQMEGELDTASDGSGSTSGNEQFVLTDLLDSDGSHADSSLDLGKLAGAGLQAQHLTDGLFA